MQYTRYSEFCIVDDGTPYELRDSVKNKCIELGYAYIYIDSTLEEFSIARCRNIGAMYAKSKFIFIQDVDLMPYDGFYKDIINEIYIQGLDYDAKKFLMVPYIFLTKYGSDEFINNSSKCKHNLFMHKAIVNDPDYIEKISCGTSANLFNRIWYLSRGGNSIDFVGWGYEDLECNTRMIRHLNFFQLHATGKHKNTILAMYCNMIHGKQFIDYMEIFYFIKV